MCPDFLSCVKKLSEPKAACCWYVAAPEATYNETAGLVPSRPVVPPSSSAECTHSKERPHGQWPQRQGVITHTGCAAEPSHTAGTSNAFTKSTKYIICWTAGCSETGQMAFKRISPDNICWWVSDSSSPKIRIRFKAASVGRRCRCSLIWLRSICGLCCAACGRRCTEVSLR